MNRTTRPGWQSISLPEDLYEQCAQEAGMRHMFLAEFVRELLREGLAQLRPAEERRLTK